MQELPFKIRDLRKKDKFFVDNVLVNHYAQIIGVYAMGVYIAFCRHADRYQGCFPSLQTIAKEMGISVRQVSRGIQRLEEHNIVRKQRLGRKMTNRYYLLDVSEWTDSPITRDSLSTAGKKGISHKPDVKKSNADNENNIKLSREGAVVKSVDKPLSDRTDRPITMDSQSNQGGLTGQSIVRIPNCKDTQERIRTSVRQLCDYWNQLKIMVHRNCKRFEPTLATCLKYYNSEEIQKAMDNYAMVLKDSKYYWRCRWSLDQFLTRKAGLDRFLPENFKKEDYLNYDEIKKTKEDRIKEADDFIRGRLKNIADKNRVKQLLIDLNFKFGEQKYWDRVPAIIKKLYPAGNAESFYEAEKELLQEKQKVALCR